MCCLVVLYQLIHRKIARRASARVAKTRPWMHSRLRLAQNDSATALMSQHAGASDGGPQLTALVEAEVKVVVGRVSAASVGVHDHPVHRVVTAAGGHRHLEGVEDELGAHVLGHRVAHSRRLPTSSTEARNSQPSAGGCKRLSG